MIETGRLILRGWREADKPGFHALVNTPAMMAHFGGPVARARHDELIDRQIDQQARFGHCMWAVELRGSGELAGICGLRIGGHPNTPVVEELEIGWRIGEKFWGQGIAREAAEASLAWGWSHTDRARIAAWTVIGNKRSWGLMERLGMRRRADLDFRHPDHSEDDPFGAMIVYAIEPSS
ncbi:GNAT family N-acetyltransferase [Sphingomonas psychrotolerans]|uniref:GNAT family N-acetyltransferase n=1 Tax=Sphingomonas psychrotolerans TaxID=1327635 RepID=A0ABU3N189_9SPHN|nr:GNAT family N-acetyltransferase [Sphingomonas psychrotolerans]MDT8758006.1 GNAT family N-acetyltransferase [Sphingomonas psychrotolerans]